MIEPDREILKGYLDGLVGVIPHAKPITAAALCMWFNRLREFHIDDVCDLIEQWPDNHSTMLTIEDARKLLIERARRNEAAKQVEQQREQAAAAVADTSCSAYRAAMARIQSLGAVRRPAPTAWIDRLRERAAAGEKLLPVQWAAIQADDKRNGRRAAAPESEAEREARLEREAIQAEAAGR